MALTGLTALETVRQPISLILMLAAVLAAAFLPLVLLYQFGEEGRLVRDGAIAIHFGFGTFLAAACAGSVLDREIRGGTAAAVLAKPVSRPLYFLSRFAGIALVIILFSGCMFVTTLLAERVAPRTYAMDWFAARLLLLAPAAALLWAGLRNFFYGRNFVSGAHVLLLVCLAAALVIAAGFDREGRPARFGAHCNWRLLPASILIALALLMLAGIALTVATRLPAIPTLSVCMIIFLLGLLSDYYFGRNRDRFWSRAVYTLMPNWQHFWLSDALARGGRIPWTYVLTAAHYALLYLAGVLTFGILSFRSRETR